MFGRVHKLPLPIKINKNQMIKKIGSKFRVIAKSGRNMGTYNSRASAEKRLRELEMFKHMYSKKK